MMKNISLNCHQFYADKISNDILTVFKKFSTEDTNFLQVDT